MAVVPGVPVKIKSPGSIVINLLTHSIIEGTSNNKSDVLLDCTVSPFYLALIAKLDGSSPVTINGPIGPNVSDDLALVH